RDSWTWCGPSWYLPGRHDRRSLVPLRLDRHRRGHVAELVLARRQPLRRFGRADAHGRPRPRLRVADHVVAEHQVVVLAADDDGRGRRLPPAVVQHDVLLEPVAMGAHRLALVAEGDAGVVVAHDAVAAEQVVRVLVPEGDAALAIPLEGVVLEPAVPHAPAAEQPVPA